MVTATELELNVDPTHRTDGGSVNLTWHLSEMTAE